MQRSQLLVAHPKAGRVTSDLVRFGYFGLATPDFEEAVALLRRFKLIRVLVVECRFAARSIDALWEVHDIRPGLPIVGLCDVCFRSCEALGLDGCLPGLYDAAALAAVITAAL